MKKLIFLASMILIAFLSIGIISASEISVNDTYVSQDSSKELLAIENVDVVSNSNNLSINNVDTILDENTIGVNNVTAKETVIDAPDITLYYKNGTKFVATLSDVDGNKLANQSLIFSVSGINYTRTTDNNGQGSLAINLIPGDYDITVYYNRNDNYLASNATATCTVYPTIQGNDITKYYRNGTQYYATFLDGQGNPLANTKVTFNINGVYYTRPTNSSGVARLNINLIPNTYILTAIHPVTEYLYSNTVTVLPTITGKDLVKVYQDGNQYYATFLDGQGNPLANTNITFNIHGVFYTRTTNSSGVARLNINLLAGDYILTGYNPNDNYSLSNTIKVLASSTTKILTSNYTYYKGEPQIITAQLINELGYGIADQEIVIAAGSTATPAKTNADGIASATVELIPGTYTVNYTYGGHADGRYKASSATNTLNVLEGIPVYFEIGNTVIYCNKKETFDVTVKTDANAAIVNKPVYFTVNGATYTRYTDENSTARLTINLDSGFYNITYRFNSTGYQDTVDCTQLLVIEGNTSTLYGENITIHEGEGEKYYVLLTAGAVPLPDRDVTFNINGVNYTRITDEFGWAGLAINLDSGKYLIKYYYGGENRIEPTSGQSYITVKKRITTSLDWDGPTTFVDMSSMTLFVKLSSNTNPISNKEIFFTIGSKSYSAVTDESGIASLEISLIPGSYVVSYYFYGDEDYLDSDGMTEILVTTSGSQGYGYWSFGADMYNIDLNTFQSLGTTDILLNFYAFTLYGESAVLDWIDSAKAHGINTHIWMQVFYSGGSWVNPVSGGSVNQKYFDTVIDEAKYYAGLKGVAGIHFDYLRYPGNAYQTSGGTAAVTEFVRQATSACRSVNPNIIMSAAVMPETTSNIYYYGQDIPAISQYLDVIIPMQYKGNYKAGSEWLASTTRWFVQNSNGAEIWSGLQSYISDDNPTKLDYRELFADAQTVLDNGADGVILFRFGLSQYLNFNDLVKPSYGDEVSVEDVINGAIEIKNHIESNYTLPNRVSMGTSTYSISQALYLMSQATLMLNKVIPTDTIPAIRVSAPQNVSSEIIHSEFSKDQYSNISSEISKFCTDTNQAPYCMHTSQGTLTYAELVYMYSRVLTSYALQDNLPAMVYVGDFLENPTLTVNMMPSYSTEEYSYRNYTTTWLNYCPQCDYYGVLLVNVKHTPEGLLTCAFCDCDYCGVTGHETIIGSNYVLTRLSESVPVTPGGDGDVVSIRSILEGASYIAKFYKENTNLPEYIVVEEGKYTPMQFLYLMDKAIVQIDAGNLSSIALIKMGDPSSSTSTIEGDLTKAQYLDVVGRVYKFIENNGVVPSYASSTLGNIPYVELVDASARILDYYYDNAELPSSVHVVNKGQSSKTIAELSRSLIAGLTTERAKATALYNYVRDEISYEFYYDTQKGAEGTLVDGSGNCCDQAQLLVAMARSVNMTARFATGYCYFTNSGAWYGHVWAQFLIDGTWINADPTSNRNSFGVIVNWDTSSYTDRGTYDILPY